MIEVKECPICSGKDFTHFLSCPDHSVSHENFELATCQHCQLAVTTPRPDESSISRYYLSNAYTSHIGAATSVMEKIYLLVRGFTLKWKLSLVEKNIVLPKRKILLDYGCGTGEFIRIAKGNGWTTLGIEPSHTARQQAARSVKNDILPHLVELPGNVKFHVITLWHVLEHVYELNSTLQKLRDLLDEDGIIFIAVPNHLSWDGRTYKKNWAGYDVPRHLWHFSRDSIKMLLEKNKMKLLTSIPMKLDAFYICLLSEKYKAHGALSIPSIAKAVFNGIRSNFYAGRNGEYSSTIFIVRK